MSDQTERTAMDDPFTMEVRLCDDQGRVTDTPVEPGSPGTIMDPDLTYLKMHNNMRARNRNPDTRKPVEEGGWQCTGHAHLAGEHIRCTNPIHDSTVAIDTALRVGSTVVIGGVPFAAPGSVLFPPMPPQEAREFASALSYADSLVQSHAPRTEAAQNCRRWLIWGMNVLRVGTPPEALPGSED